jgi:hypothetical protein
LLENAGNMLQSANWKLLGMAMADNERGLFGNAAQRKLQAGALAAASEYRDTPGAVFAARMAGTDDPEKLGWDRIEGILRNDGAITFRMLVCLAVVSAPARKSVVGGL